MAVVDLYCNQEFIPDMGNTVAEVAFLRAEQILMVSYSHWYCSLKYCNDHNVAGSYLVVEWIIFDKCIDVQSCYL